MAAEGLERSGGRGFVNELLANGRPGRRMFVDVLYREGKKVGGGPEVLEKHS